MSGGYHLTEIPKGTFGESSKILEEVLELRDSEAQGCRLMALMELADVVGAVTGYLRKYYPGMTWGDLYCMAEITERAFQTGDRK